MYVSVSVTGGVVSRKVTMAMLTYLSNQLPANCTDHTWHMCKRDYTVVLEIIRVGESGLALVESSRSSDPCSIKVSPLIPTIPHCITSARGMPPRSLCYGGWCGAHPITWPRPAARSTKEGQGVMIIVISVALLCCPPNQQVSDPSSILNRVGSHLFSSYRCFPATSLQPSSTKTLSDNYLPYLTCLANLSS